MEMKHLPGLNVVLPDVDGVRLVVNDETTLKTYLSFFLRSHQDEQPI